MEAGLSRKQTITLLTKSPHRDLAAYTPVGVQAVTSDPEFFAHLIAWNAMKGQIRDAKVALPVLALTGAPQFHENALAHLANLNPRMLLQAWHFAKNTPGVPKRAVNRLVSQYLRSKELEQRIGRLSLLHREPLTSLYALTHTKPDDFANRVLFKGEPTGQRRVLAGLKDVSDPLTAAAMIREVRAPFLVLRGSIPKRLWEQEDVLLAVIDAMSATELVTNTKSMAPFLKTPALRGAWNEALGRTQAAKANTLKTAKAVAATEGSSLGEVMKGHAERQLDTLGVEGDWIVLCDVSGSMQRAIEQARLIAGILTRVAKGSVNLLFVNDTVRSYDATGKSITQIQVETSFVRASGGTLLGVGLDYAREKSLPCQGIVLVSDGGDNRPSFWPAYRRLAAHLDMDPPVYHYDLPGDPNQVKIAHVDEPYELFDLRAPGAALDEYSLPNLIQTMRTSRFSLVDEIFSTPLLSLADVLTLEPKA